MITSSITVSISTSGKWEYSSSLPHKSPSAPPPHHTPPPMMTTFPSVWPLINMDHEVALSQQRRANEEKKTCRTLSQVKLLRHAPFELEKKDFEQQKYDTHTHSLSLSISPSLSISLHLSLSLSVSLHLSLSLAVSRAALHHENKTRPNCGRISEILTGG